MCKFVVLFYGADLYVKFMLAVFTTPIRYHDIMQYKQQSKTSIKSRGLKFIRPTAETPEAIIHDLETIYNRTKFYALTSGGKDSMTVCHWLAEQGKLEAAVHIQTNIGVRETTDWLVSYCDDMNWKLYTIQPKPKFTYASFVLEYGFPGPMAHKMIMGLLKYKTMRDFALTIDRHNHCLLSGVRKFESQRRLGNYPEPIQNDGNMWFGCPFFYYTTEEIYRYVHIHGIKITPVHRTLGMSGECMCGSYATKGEKRLIKDLDVSLAGYIEWLEEGVQRFGTPQAKRHSTWGGSIKMSDIEQQKMLDIFFDARPDLKDVEQMQYGICGEECGAGTMRGTEDY